MVSIILQVIFWLCVIAIFYSYVIYPFLLNILGRNKRINTDVYHLTDTDLPTVTFITAVYNEEKVIGEKLESVFKTTYPLEKITYLIGSDNSTDQSHEIIHKLQKKYPQIKLQVFKNRQGKANILNQLQPQAEGEICIFTDANVLFQEDTIFHLVKHFKNAAIAQVGANFLNKGMEKEGISYQEEGYIKRETKIKYLEGIIWGCMMGAFGGCHAVRTEDYIQNPPNFLMEDFYLSMHILTKGKKAILEPRAIVYEDVPSSVFEEFKRKVRISAGNFQNLSVYKNTLLNITSPVAFTFFSHKVLRWFGPFLIILSWLIAAYLGLWEGNFLYLFLFIGESFLLLAVPLLDYLLKQFSVYIGVLRYVTYFLAMNIALIRGFIKYVGGVKTNAWQPPERNK